MSGKEKIVAKFKRDLITAFVLVCFVASAALTETGAVSKISDQSQRLASKAKERKTAKERSAAPALVRAIIWRDPVDLESRNLFYGIGGRKGAPDPSAPFTFVKHSKSGTQKKVIVKDNQGREWTVKFGREARPETVATRIVWAVGYHADQDYFVRRARIIGKENIDARDVRFERRDDGFEEEGNWSWKENPFVGTRELNGLKILMALLKNWDIKSPNNEIARPIGSKNARIYYVSDLGATFGQTGTWLHRIPFFTDMPATYGSASKAKGDPKAFAEEKFIEEVEDGNVSFYQRRLRGRRLGDDIPIAHARWMGNLLGRLSNKQLTDAFRAGGFNKTEVAQYVSIMRERIRQLRSL